MALTGTATNIAFAHRDWIQEPGTVLTGSNWLAGLPLTNLQNYDLSRVARSTTPDALTPYILVDFGVALTPPITGIIFPKHNLFQTARWRIRIGSDPSFSLGTVAYDTRPTLGTTTSLTSLIVGAPQTLTLIVAAALTFFPGVNVVIKSNADPTGTYMLGTVVSYDNDAKRLVVTASTAVGSGSFSDWTVVRQDSDITVWPQVIPLGEGWWGAGYTWGGLLKVDPSYRPPAIHLIPLATGDITPIYQRYLRIDLSDPDNPDGYIDISKLVVSPIYQPTINLPYGWEIEMLDPSPKGRTRGSRFWVDPRPPYPLLSISLSHLQRDEMFTQAWELERRLGVKLPCAVIVDPTTTTHLHRLFVYGSLVRTSKIREEPYGFTKSFEFEGWT